MPNHRDNFLQFMARRQRRRQISPEQLSSSVVDLASDTDSLPSSPSPIRRASALLFSHEQLLESAGRCRIDCDLSERSITLTGCRKTIMSIVTDRAMWDAQYYSTTEASRDCGTSSLCIKCVRVEQNFISNLTEILVMMGYMGLRWWGDYNRKSFECTYVGPGATYNSYTHTACRFCDPNETRVCVFFKPLNY